MLPVLKYHQLSNKQFKEKYGGHSWEGFSTFVFPKYLFLYQTPCIFQKRPQDNTNKYECKANKATWEVFWPYAPAKAVPMVTLVPLNHWIASDGAAIVTGCAVLHTPVARVRSPV